MGFDAAGWLEAVNESQGGEAPPDAIYDAELTKCDLITAGDGRQWLKMFWRALAGPHRDSEWSSLHTLDRFKPDGERNAGLGFTVDTLRKMGYDVDDPAKASSAVVIQHHASELVGNSYSVEVKTNGQFTNTYVKSLLATAQPSLPGTGYGQPRQSPNGSSLAEAATHRQDIERTGASDVTTAADVAAFDRSTAPKQGDVDPETGEPIPF